MKTADRALISMIPVYPKACSAILLAFNAGYIKAKHSPERISAGLGKLEKRIALLTFKEPRLAERRAILQLTTKDKLKEAGFSGDALDEIGSMPYYSLLPVSEPRKEGLTDEQ